MKKKMLVMLLAVAVCVSMIAAATYAWFTDEDDAGTATFTAGVLDIEVSDGFEKQFDGIATIEHMNPGDEFGPIEIEIVNEGTKNLMWLGDLQFLNAGGEKNDDNPLLDAMYISYAKMEHLDEDDQTWSDPDVFIDGTDSDLPSLMAIPAPLTNGGESNIDKVMTLSGFDDHKQNGGHGEFAGALIPQNKYKLTLKFAFHESAGNDYQGIADSDIEPIDVGFKVNAYQLNAKYYKEIEETLDTSLGAYSYYTNLIDIQENAGSAE